MTYRIFTTCFAIVIVLSSIAAQSWSDTLASVSEDTVKLDLIIKEFNKEVYANPSRSFELVDLFDAIAGPVNNEYYNARGHNIRGMAHYVSGQYNQAIDYFVTSISYFEKIHNKAESASVYNNLSTCYQVTGDNEKSIAYSLKALSLFEELKDSSWIASVNSNLGLLYLNDKNLAEADRCLDVAVPLLSQMGKDVALGITYLSRGNLRYEQARYDASIIDYKLAMELVPKNVVPVVHAAAKGGIGTVYNKMGKTSLALKYLKESLAEASVLDQKEQLKESNRELSAVYEKIGDYKNSLIHERNYNLVKDELLEGEKDQRIVAIMAKYETAKKEQEISELNAENQVNAAKLKARNRQVLGLILGAVMLIGFLLSVYRLNRKISDQNQVISKTLNEKDTLLREIHHRVKNNLQVISSLLALQSKYIQDDNAIDALQSGQDRVQSMALIHQDLYQADNLKGVDTEMYLEQLIENLFETYKIDEESIELETQIDSVLLDVDTMIPLGLVVNELISNALKHAFERDATGVIRVIFEDKKDKLFLQVSDNGKGLEDLSVLKNTSFGYSLVESFANKLDAEVITTSEGGLSVSLDIKRFKRAT